MNTNTITDAAGNEMTNVGTPWDTMHMPSAADTVGSATQKLAKTTGRAGRMLALATLLATSPMMQSCKDPEGKVEPDKYAGMTQEQKMEAWHQEAEAEATKLGWSQGVRSLAAGVIDYYYYKESANGPLLIRLSYQVDVEDFIKKIETDAKNRGTYDPKTEGVFQASVVSLEGDGKQNTWFVPSSAIYEAKAQGKQKLSLEIGVYPSPNQGRNTINVNEGIVPNKQMQLYSGYGIKNATKTEDRVKDVEKRGALKDIL